MPIYPPSVATSWLWQDRIPKGSVTVFAGSPGVGQSFVTSDLAARVSRGARFPSSTAAPHPPGNVFIVSDDPHDTVLAPRLISAGAEMDRIFLLHGPALAGYTPDETGVLAAARERAGGLSLVVIDTPLAIDSIHDHAEVRGILSALTSWLESIEDPPALILIAHATGKASRSVGDSALVKMARNVHILAADRQHPGQATFTPTKAFHANPAEPLAYQIVASGDCARVMWRPRRGPKA